ncbi:MAG TPA: thioesterase family protein [Steroidobacteraceae bacterium]
MSDLEEDSIDGLRLAQEVAALDYSSLVIRDDYLDRNGHLNTGYYAVLIDRAAELTFRALGMGWARIREAHVSQFSLTSRLIHYREVFRDSPLSFSFRMLDLDDKRVHFFITMLHAREGWAAAASEGVSMCIDISKRRSMAWPPAIKRRLEALLAVHRRSELPKDAGQRVAMRRAH